MSRRKSYSYEFKLTVIKYAKSNGKRAAARIYDIDEKNVRRWLADETHISNMPRIKCTRRGRSCFWPVLEHNLAAWVRSQHEDGQSVSTLMIRVKAKSMAEEMKLNEFKGGTTWCKRFMTRNKLCIRERKSVGQELPTNWEEKEAEFHQFVQDTVEKYSINPSQIINIDEVPLTFDFPGNRTVSNKGEKSVLISTTGNEKTQFTVVLACTATGEKLKPMIIFKRITMPCEKFSDRVEVQCNKKGCMDNETIKFWIEKIWCKRKGGCFIRHGLLIMDSMRAQISNEAKSVCVKAGAELAIIPGGLTKKLQPLDLSINHVFKAKISDMWEQWMTEGIHTYTLTGRMHRATYTQVCEWVEESWKYVSTSIIINSFKKAGIIKQDDENRNDDDNHKNQSSLENEQLSDWLSFSSDSDESHFSDFCSHSE